MAYVAHELAAEGTGLFVEGGGEHHDLLLARALHVQRLHLAAHVKAIVATLDGAGVGLEHLVALVNDKVLDVAELQVAVLHEMVQAAGRADNNVLRARWGSKDGSVRKRVRRGVRRGQGGARMNENKQANKQTSKQAK